MALRATTADDADGRTTTLRELSRDELVTAIEALVLLAIQVEVAARASPEAPLATPADLDQPLHHPRGARPCQDDWGTSC